MSEADAALFSLEVAFRFDFDYIQLEGDALTAPPLIIKSLEFPLFTFFMIVFLL